MFGFVTEEKLARSEAALEDVSIIKYFDLRIICDLEIDIWNLGDVLLRKTLFTIQSGF